MPPLATTEHCQISCRASIALPKQQSYPRHIWIYSKADWEGLNYAIENYNWQPCFEIPCINEMASIFSQSLLNLTRQFIPNKTVTIRTNDQPWYNNLLRSIKRQRDRLFSTAKSLNTPEAWDNYRQCRNSYVQSLKEAKCSYNDCLASSLDTKDLSGRNWWQTIKTFIGINRSDTIPAILLPTGTAVHDNLSKAQALNNFFVSHSTIDYSNAALPADRPLTHDHFNSLQLTET